MGTPQDNRILLFTRIIACVVILVLLLAFAVLYLAPDHTDVNFPWTVMPRTSAILFGVGYSAGAYFFVRLLIEKKWHRVQAGFLPIAAFTTCILTATLLHWDRFHHGTFNFYLWTIVYAVTPFLIPFVWWQNRHTEAPGLEEHDFRFSAPVRWLLGITGVAGNIAFLIVFAQPSILISLAPWQLTELTARIFAGWCILAFSTVLSIAFDGRWSATRILMESAMVGILLTLLALPRMWRDFDQAKPLTYVFVGGVVFALIAFTATYIRLVRSSRSGN